MRLKDSMIFTKKFSLTLRYFTRLLLFGEGADQRGPLHIVSYIHTVLSMKLQHTQYHVRLAGPVVREQTITTFLTTAIHKVPKRVQDNHFLYIANTNK